MCDYVERIICAAISGAVDEKVSIINELENDIADLKKSNQKDKESLLELMEQDLAIVKALEIYFNEHENVIKIM